jgi:hypothetical protein
MFTGIVQTVPVQIYLSDSIKETRRRSLSGIMVNGYWERAGRWERAVRARGQPPAELPARRALQLGERGLPSGLEAYGLKAALAGGQKGLESVLLRKKAHAAPFEERFLK